MACLNFLALTLGSNRRINTSPTTVDEKEILKKPLVTPAIRAIELHFSYGLVVTARNRTGVTIKDALEVIYNKYKKKVILLSNTDSCPSTTFICLILV